MKLLFTHSYFLRFDPKQWKLQQPYPPLGTLFAAAAARREGHDVRFFDPMFSTSPDEILPFLEEAPDVLVIVDDGFNYLTKMCLTNMRDAAFQMLGMARSRGIPAIVNSSDASDRSEDYLGAGASFVITGEVETTLAELLTALQNRSDAKVLDGLVFMEEGKLVRTRPREVMRTLDALPFPAWDLVDLPAYRSRWEKSSGYFSLNLSTTRGCPFHCNWCAKPIYGNRYNVHSPERAVEELKVLVRQFRADHIWMTDDIFGLKPGWVQQFADLLEKEKLNFRFKIQSRVDLLLQEDTLEALARAGCDTIWVGAESGAQRILDAMDKGTRVEQIYAATRLMKKYGIKPAFFLQFGYPGETKEDIDATLKMVMDLMPDDIGISISYPLPGTPFHEKVKDQLRQKSNWTDSDEMALLFHNTYPAAFYKELQRYVHRAYRTRQGLAEVRNLFHFPVSITPARLRRIAGVPLHFSGSVFHRKRMDILSRKKSPLS